MKKVMITSSTVVLLMSAVTFLLAGLIIAKTTETAVTCTGTGAPFGQGFYNFCDANLCIYGSHCNRSNNASFVACTNKTLQMLINYATQYKGVQDYTTIFKCNCELAQEYVEIYQDIEMEQNRMNRMKRYSSAAVITGQVNQCEKNQWFCNYKHNCTTTPKRTCTGTSGNNSTSNNSTTNSTGGCPTGTNTPPGPTGYKSYSATFATVGSTVPGNAGFWNNNDCCYNSSTFSGGVSFCESRPNGTIYLAICPSNYTVYLVVCSPTYICTGTATNALSC